MSTPTNVPKTFTTFSKENIASTPALLPAPTSPKPDDLGTPGRDDSARAIAAATDAGQAIGRKFAKLDQRQRLTVVRMFRRQLLPPGKPGRRRSKEITAAYADWKQGVRGLALYKKHIRGLDKMSYWKRKVKTRALDEALRSRERRERKTGDSGEAERLFRREAERHSGMIPNTIGA